MRKFLFSASIFVLVAIIGWGVLGLNNKSANARMCTALNELTVNGSQWVEIENGCEEEINFQDYVLVTRTQDPNSINTTTLPSRIIPGKGLLALELEGNPFFSGTSTLVELYIYNGEGYYGLVSQMSYGAEDIWGLGETHILEPTSGQSAVVYEGKWSATTTVSKGWFNNAKDFTQIGCISDGSYPTLASLATCYASREERSSLGNLLTNIASINNPTRATNLYFENTGSGKVQFNGTMNLTGYMATDYLKSLLGSNEGLNIDSVGKLFVYSDWKTALNFTTATLVMYSLGDLGFTSEPGLIVKDDKENIILPGDPTYPTISDKSYSPTNNTFTFTTDHFSVFEVSPKVEFKGIPEVVNKDNLSFEVSTNATGTITFLGDCSASSPVSVSNGGGKVVINNLSEGIHDACSFRFTDEEENSVTLAMGTFSVDFTPPQITKAETIDANTIEITFDEDITNSSFGAKSFEFPDAPVAVGDGCANVYETNKIRLGCFRNKNTGKSSVIIPQNPTIIIDPERAGEYIQDLAGNLFVSTTVVASDVAAPTIEESVLGKGDSDYQLSCYSGASEGVAFADTLTFTEELNADSKLAVQTALSNGTTSTLSFRWGAGNLARKLMVYIAGDTKCVGETATFPKDVLATITDLAGNTTENALLVNSSDLQELIKAASAGDTVIIPAGTYYDCLTIDKNLILTSASATNTIINAAYCEKGALNIEATATNIDAVTVSNLTFENSAKDFRWTNFVYVSGGGELTISGVTFDNLIMTEGGYSRGIYFGNADGEIKNSNIQNFCSGIYLDYVNNGMVIQGNTIKKNGLDKYCSATGIDVYESSNVTIRDNDISENDNGIYFSSKVEENLGIVISNNKFSGNNGVTDEGGFGIINKMTSFVSATMNWWGSASGPKIASNPSGRGDAIYGNVRYAPWAGNDKFTAVGGVVDEENNIVLDDGFDTSNEGYILTIPSSTRVTGITGWDGIINPPTVTTISNPPTKSGYTTTMGDIIEVGYSSGKLILSKAAKLVFPGEAGKKVGYTRPSESFTEITTVCGANTQEWADDNLDTEGDCKIDSYPDLIVWTKHFTTFATYSQTQNSTGGGGGVYSVPMLGTEAIKVSEGTTVAFRNITFLFNVTNASHVAISEKLDFSDTAWQIYSASKGFILSEGSGQKTVYIKFKSTANYETAVQNIKISLDIAGTQQYTTGYTPPMVAGTTISPITASAIQFRAGLTERQKQMIVNLVNSERKFTQADAKNYAYSIGSGNWQQFVGTNPKALIKSGKAFAPAVFTIQFRAGLTDKQKQAITALVNTGRNFTQADAKNYAYAIGTSNWQQFVGKNPRPFTISFRYGLTAAQRKTITDLVNTGKKFSEADAKNYAYAINTTNWQQFVGKNPRAVTVKETSGFTIKFRAGLTDKQKQAITALVNTGRKFSETDAKNYAYAIGTTNWQQFVGKNPKGITQATGFTIKFRAGLTDKQKQAITALVNTGRNFTEIDAKNYAYAIGTSNWQQFVGKNPAK